MPTSKLTYSTANPEIHDYDSVYELCKEAADAIEGHTVDEDGMHNIVSTFYYSEDISKGIMLLAFDEDKPVGVLSGLRIFNHFLFGDSFCMEAVLWIKPEYRKTRAMLKLLNAYERWANNIGCTKIGLSDIHHDERLKKMYTKRGYKLFECAYIKDIEV